MLLDFKRRFWFSLLATVPVLILSPLIQSLLGIDFQFSGDSYLLFIISTFVFFFGGWPFIKGLFDELKKRKPGMMTLIALAITVAYGYSSTVVFGLPGKVFFWELVTLIDVMLLGHWIEMRSVMGASMALEKLAKLMPSEAHLIEEAGAEKDVRIEELKKGNLVLVKPGEKIPVDGQIAEGESEIDVSMITGESEPVRKKKNDEVIGGSVNGTGALKVEVTKAGKDSYLAQVVEMVKKAGESKSKAQAFADKAAFWLTMIAITVGSVTLVSWLAFEKEFVYALERMVTVMVITCPHALGLAVPLVIAVITALSAKNGLLIRNRTAFEGAWSLQTIVFDKTGTLTKGEFGVTDVLPMDETEVDDLLKKAAAVESNSEHSIARGIVQEAKKRNFGHAKTDKFEAVPGKGAKARVDGEIIYVGNSAILEESGISSGEGKQKAEDVAAQGKTVVFVSTKERLLGIIALADLIRDESREAIESLKKMNLEIAMITGDNEATATHVAQDLGIDTFFAEVLPDQKSEKIEELQKQKKRVAMVGDGVNDAPALAKADVGIAIGAGTDVAVETADVVLVNNDPRDAVDVVSLSKITRKKMKQNLAWATGYNIIAIPLAAGVLYKFGFVMPPALGALVMSISTVIVAINARLVKFQ
jgi:Cu2+-exporting ATPase